MSGFPAFMGDLARDWPLIMAGLGNTLLLSAIVSVTGFIGGIVVFYLSQSPIAAVRSFIRGYVSFFVGMPLIVLLFLMYYGAPELGLRLAPLTVAIIGFTFNVAAYNAAYLTTA